MITEPIVKEGRKSPANLEYHQFVEQTSSSDRCSDFKPLNDSLDSDLELKLMYLERLQQQQIQFEELIEGQEPEDQLVQNQAWSDDYKLFSIAEQTSQREETHRATADFHSYD